MGIPTTNNTLVMFGSCTYDLQKDILDVIRKAGFKCDTRSKFNLDCNLPIKPGKFTLDGITFPLPDEFDVPEIVLMAFKQFFSEPINISLKVFGPSMKVESICLEGTIEIDL